MNEQKTLHAYFAETSDTPIKLADRAGVHFTTIYNILRGADFRRSTWERIERAMLPIQTQPEEAA